MKPPFSIYRITKQRSDSLPLHSHQEGQLTYAASGMVQIHTDAGVWMVPPQLAAWVPPDLHHRLEIMTDAELWMVHWQPSAVRAWGRQVSLDRAFALWITPLLRSLLNEAVSTDLEAEKAELVVRLMLHELTAMEEAPTFLPLPTSPVGKCVADLALADHRNLLSLSEIASRSATSVRTVTRLFPLETGLTLKAWRQRARIVWAMEQLARGHAPSHVARQTGYASTAAFCSAFRQVTAMTPTAFMSRGAEVP
ncbi:AraC family transcriptional regulator [Gloeobacter kilaueensis JS1]|uniref:AraC family transcriptional regulator n=1 Tax=Gloeobacter kilaueensis (strain ATCC BAA-2537 / CCAP 1431/1 / ULC 316 / JS1) TaxID=1183438 RepID=U5QJY9_GLOK1|nr:AraC family transcriptional regulator [Gloeobacter kilaueensis JS1]